MPFSWLLSLVFEKRSRDTYRFSFHKISSGFESKQTLHLFTKQIKTYNNEPTTVTEATTNGITQNGKSTRILPDVPQCASLRGLEDSGNRQKIVPKRRCRVERGSRKENSRGAMARSRAWSVANPPVSSISIRSNTSTSNTSGITSSSEMYSPSCSLSRAPLTTAFVSTNGSTARSLSLIPNSCPSSRGGPPSKSNHLKKKRESCFI
jgi:hypothetical protein